MTQKNATPHIWIDDDVALAKTCAALSKEDAIALDSECVRERTYHPVAALAQIATQHDVFLIDLVAIKDFSPLCQLLSNPSVTKIIHSMLQDQEILQSLGCRSLTAVFDTQVAAAFLGKERQISYKSLVYKYLGIDLPKSCTRSNWVRRPLTEQQKEYALEDVLYLIPLYEMLQQDLREQNKFEWFDEENQRILEYSQHHPEAKLKQIYSKVKGKGKLRQRSDKEKLQALIAWREKMSALIDMPRKWLLDDASLVGLACLTPLCAQGITPLTQTLPKKSGTQYRAELLALLEGIADDDTPLRSLSLTVAQRNKVKAMTEQVAELAERHHIDSTLIATQKEITRWVAPDEAEESSLLNSGWRKALLEKS